MRKVVWVILVLFSILPLICEEPGTNEVFAPFVSRLDADVRDASVLLTWRDSTGVSGWNLIYRHTAEITQGTIDEASLIARIAKGQETYFDRPPDTQPYFYSILVESEEGTRYSLFIPFRNKTIAGVQVPYEDDPAKGAAQISQLSAVSGHDSITVSFLSSRSDRELFLFRSSTMISGYSDLIEGVSWILSPGLSSYQDKPPAGVAYYYAVLDAEMVKLGKVELTSGVNTTQYPAQLPLGSVKPELESADSLRTLPLPFLIISKNVESGEALAPRLYLPETREIASETQNAVDRLLADLPPAAQADKQLEMLAVDRVNQMDGQAAALKSIIEGSLFTGSYAEAQTELQTFLTIRRTEDLESRARFYLGQAFFFQGRYRKALIEFLLARDAYYLQVRGWLDACFDVLASVNNQP